MREEGDATTLARVMSRRIHPAAVVFAPVIRNVAIAGSGRNPVPGDPDVLVPVPSPITRRPDMAVPRPGDRLRGQDVQRLKPRRGADLAHEALGSQGDSELCVQNFVSHREVMLEARGTRSPFQVLLSYFP